MKGLAAGRMLVRSLGSGVRYVAGAEAPTAEVVIEGHTASIRTGGFFGALPASNVETHAIKTK